MTPKYSTRPRTDSLIIHCSATRASMDIGAKEIRKWHVEENGWVDIGYHFVIRRNGVIESGRPLKVIGAHVADYNLTSVGICLVGGTDRFGLEENNFTKEQWDELKWLVRFLRDDVYEGQITSIKGHRDYPNVQKYCPSFDVAEWLKREGV